MSSKQCTRLAHLQKLAVPKVSVRPRSAVAATLTPEVEQPKPLASSAWEAAKPFNDIPGPKSYPLLKSVPAFISGDLNLDINRMYDFMSNAYGRYGPLVRLEFPFVIPLVMVMDPALAETCMREGVGVNPRRIAVEHLKYYRTKTRKDVFKSGPGVAVLQGEEWQKLRSIIQKPLMRPRSALIYLPAMNEVSNAFIEKIKESRDENMDAPTNFQAELGKWALESVALIGLDTRLNCLDTQLNPQSDAYRMLNAVQDFFTLMGELEFNMPLWKVFNTKTFKKFVQTSDILVEIASKHVNNAVERTKEKVRNDNDNLSVLEQLIADPKLKMDDAATVALDVLVAGIDTTSNGMAFVLYNLAKNPEVQEKVFEEVVKILPEKDSPLTESMLNKIPYTKAVLKESLRLNPVIMGTMRNTDKDIVVNGYQIPKNTNVLMCNWQMSRHEKNYPDSLKFKPERWIQGHAEKNTSNPHSYMPFGHGARMCLGKRLAEHEMWVLIAKLVRNFKLHYNNGELDIITRFVNVPAVPMQFKFEDRQQ